MADLTKLRPGVRVHYTDSLGKVRRGIVTVVNNGQVYMKIDGKQGPVWFEPHELDRLTIDEAKPERHR